MIKKIYNGKEYITYGKICTNGELHLLAVKNEGKENLQDNELIYCFIIQKSKKNLLIEKLSNEMDENYNDIRLLELLERNFSYQGSFYAMLGLFKHFEIKYRRCYKT